MTTARFCATVGALLTLLVFPAAGSAAPQPFGNDLANGPTNAINGTQTTYSPRTGGTAGAQTMPVAAPISGVVTNFKIRHGAGQSGTVKWFIATKTAENTFASRFAATKAAAAGDAGNITSHTPLDGASNPVGVPISAGEYIAAHSTGGLSMQVFSNTLAPGGKYAFFFEAEPPAAATGWNVTDPAANGGREATVQATVEPDGDGDGYGDDSQDACDADATAHLAPCPTTDQDSDGIPNNNDNCPAIANPDQKNTDGDALGDVCDSDDDNDGLLDGPDNCDVNANPGQEDLDTDGQGDVCDADDDGDGAADGSDNCPVLANANQTNTDNDALGDACDGDDDGDTVLDGSDNCEKVANLDQKNTDGASDGGDACDADDDNDGVPDALDAGPLDPNNRNQVADNDKDGSPATQDCDDNNPAVRPGAIEIPGNKVDENCDKLVAPFAKLAARFSQSTKNGRTSTRFTKLDVTKVVKGAVITVTCRNAKGKKTCPFSKKTVNVKTAGTVKLLSLFKKRSLAIGTVTIVKVSVIGSIGRVATYTMRAGKAPKRKLTCAEPSGKTVAC